MTRKDFGKVPNYMNKIKSSIEIEKKEIAQLKGKLNEDEMRSK